MGVPSVLFDQPFPEEVLEELMNPVRFAIPLFAAIMAGPMHESPMYDSPAPGNEPPLFEGRDLQRGLSLIGYDTIAVPQGVVMGIAAGGDFKFGSATTTRPCPILMMRAKSGHMMAFLAPVYDAEVQYYKLNEMVYVFPEALEAINQHMKEVASKTDQATQAASDFMAEPTATLFD